MRSRTRCGLVLATAALLLLTTGCDDADKDDRMTSSPEIQINTDPDLRRQLTQLSANRATARLADLTSWSWTEVYVFAEGASAKTIEEQTGSKVIDQDRYYEAGNLLVFVDDEEIVHVSSILPDLLVTDGRYTWPNSVRLSPHGSATPALLRLSAS